MRDKSNVKWFFILKEETKKKKKKLKKIKTFGGNLKKGEKREREKEKSIFENLYLVTKN